MPHSEPVESWFPVQQQGGGLLRSDPESSGSWGLCPHVGTMLSWQWQIVVGIVF